MPRPPSSPPHGTHYPPRAGRLWVGRRAKVAFQAERARTAFLRTLRWLLAAAIPGLPFYHRGHRALALMVFTAWATTLAAFLIWETSGARGRSLLWFPGFRTVQLDAVYLVFGLAAGIHIMSTNEHLRPPLQARLAGLDWRPRLALTIVASLGVAAFLYFALYAPLLGS